MLSFGGWRDRAFLVSSWEARFRAAAIREQDPQQARELYEEALAGDPDDKWGLYDFACWHALYGDEAEARRRSTARSSSAATKCASRPPRTRTSGLCARRSIHAPRTAAAE